MSKEFVTLSSGKVLRNFTIEQANKLLNLRFSCWKLQDANYKFNGTELAKVKKA